MRYLIGLTLFFQISSISPLQSFPFENVVTGISVLIPLNLPLSGGRQRRIGQGMSDAMGTKSAEVNGTKSKSLRTKRAKVPQTAKEPRTGLFYLFGSPFVYTGGFGDDFAAAVDFRGSRAALTDPKNANSRCGARRTKIPKKSQAKNNTNLDLSSWFVLFLSGTDVHNQPKFHT